MKTRKGLIPIAFGLGAAMILSPPFAGAEEPGKAPESPGRSQGSSRPPWADSPPFSSHSFIKPLPNAEAGGKEVAILAGGCFWCLEAVFELLPGVSDVVSGYTGGAKDRPSYGQVSSGLSGHAEAVRIVFDPKVLSYGQILELFWKIHDPTTLNRQGADVGTQYRSAIYWTTEEQRRAAAASIEGQRSVWRNPVVTELKPAGKFWIAEEYHQDYYRRNPEKGYCQVVISPKVEKSGLGR